MKVSIRKKKLQNGTTSLYLDIYHRGKRNYEFLNIYLDKNKEENKEKILLAEKIRAKREVELQNNQYGFIPEFNKRNSFIKYYEEKIKDKHKWSNYYSTLKALKQYVKTDISFYQINEEWLEKFKRFLLSQHTQNTASTYYQVFTRILKQAKREKVISENPAEFVKHIPLVTTERKYLIKEELEKLGKTDCQIKDVKKAFLFSCFTGLRFSDVKSLTWGDIKENQIRIRQQKTKEFIYIPLSSTAKSILLQNGNHNTEEEKIFNFPNKWFTNEILKRWFKIAEIKKNAHFHMARHSFATLNLTEGNDLYTVSKLLGHRHISTTEIYAKIIDKKKDEAISKLPTIEVNL